MSRLKCALLALVVAGTIGSAGCPAPMPSERMCRGDGDTSEGIPCFPWPPPRASGHAVVPREALAPTGVAAPTFGSVDGRLRAALDGAGYFDSAYFAVPDGFALVTRLEQIEEDGTPKPVPERWFPDLQPLRSFSLQAYLAALFTAQPGYYRILVFVVTDRPFGATGAAVSREEANAWLSSGAAGLPASLQALSFTAEHACTALVYEFEQADRGRDAVLRSPGRLSARAHLVGASVWGRWAP